MGAWNITASPELISAMVKMSADSGSNFSANTTAGFNSDYAKILQQQISQLENDSTTQNQDVGSVEESNSISAVETIKRFKPDGTIMLTTYEDGKITEQIKIKPHLVPVPDYDAPLTPEGKIDVKYVPHFNLMDLLML